MLTSLAVIPGPSDILVAASAIRRGYGSAVRITLGILVADLIFILAVVLGANALMTALDAYAQWLNWLSAGILIIMGLWMLRSKVTSAELNSADTAPQSYGFAAGFGITFCDPKALAFYFGVLPTFFDLPSFGAVEYNVQPKL